MKRMNLFCMVMALMLAGPTFAAIDTIAVDVGISVFKTMPIGIVPFEEESAIKWPSEAPHKILTRDANLSGRFEAVPSDRFDLVLFSKKRARQYVTGKAEKLANGKIKLDCFLYAAETKDALLGESYTVKPYEVRRAIHSFFDKVVYRLFGERGVASTKLAYVSKIEGVKQVVISDYDGFSRKQITRDSSINMMPVWQKGNKGLVYVNFRNNRPSLYSIAFGGKETPIFTQFSQTFSPAVNPKTGELLFAVTDEGKTELYRGDMKKGTAQKFLHLKSNQVSPSWSPYASEVLFTSDRGGSPQVYAVGKDGTDVRRITYMGHYNERASWSPEGDRIVYTSMDDGKMNIYTCALDGTDIVQLTSNAGNNEHPSWSPDGKLIAFASDRGGNYQIYIMRKDGSGVTRITNGTENTSPTWSWYFDEKKKK
ncbi:MAG: PD40 domain-containing protein [Fibrobacter sp.]|nr:PD40 domain-containing protein [Fibrobacter sp.]